MAHNNNIGKISDENVSIKGSENLDTTSLSGSILGLRYIKDSSTAGTGGTGTAPTDIGSVALKNWFETYVGGLGNYVNSSGDDTNIKWGDYKGATILGMKLEACNETDTRYDDANNAQIQITPLNGNGLPGTYTIIVGGTTVTTAGNRGTTYTSPGFDSGRNVSVVLIDEDTGVSIQMFWTTGFDTGVTSIRGSDSVAGP